MLIRRRQFSTLFQVAAFSETPSRWPKRREFLLEPRRHSWRAPRNARVAPHLKSAVPPVARSGSNLYERDQRREKLIQWRRQCVNPPSLNVCIVVDMLVLLFVFFSMPLISPGCKRDEHLKQSLASVHTSFFRCLPLPSFLPPVSVCRFQPSSHKSLTRLFPVTSTPTPFIPDVLTCDAFPPFTPPPSQPCIYLCGWWPQQALANVSSATSSSLQPLMMRKPLLRHWRRVCRLSVTLTKQTRPSFRTPRGRQGEDWLCL